MIQYLSETIKAVSKRTPNEWIDSYVTIELRMLLRNTQKSIKDLVSPIMQIGRCITVHSHFGSEPLFGTMFTEPVI